MEEKEIKLVNRVFQDATVGMLAIDKILKKIENETLRKLFEKQYDMYEKFANKCDMFAANNDFEIKENSFFKKTRQVVMLYMMLWMDKSPRHIVEMMINGTVMGIVDTIKAEKDLKTKNEDLNLMVEEFKKLQEDFYEKLKKQLYKV
jgi:hypothetical protein